MGYAVAVMLKFLSNIPNHISFCNENALTVSDARESIG